MESDSLLQRIYFAEQLKLEEQDIADEPAASVDDSDYYSEYSDEDEDAQWELEKQKFIQHIRTLIPLIFKVIGSTLATRCASLIFYSFMFNHCM
jgi:hypothetical protein